MIRKFAGSHTVTFDLIASLKRIFLHLKMLRWLKRQHSRIQHELATFFFKYNLVLIWAYW